MTTPAMRAPISFERPAHPAIPATRKHHAIALTTTSSEDLAMTRKYRGSTKRARSQAPPTSPATATSDFSRSSACMFCRLGWIARKAMA